MPKIQLAEKIWIQDEKGFKFKENVDPKTGDKKIIIKGLLLPYDTISRNGVKYNKNSIKDRYKQLINKPFLFNHVADGENANSYGHVIESEIMDEAMPGWESVYSEPGWYYAVDIDPLETKFVHKLRRGDTRHVSIQLIGDSVEEAFDEAGKPYTEAWVGDIIELSAVNCPGFLDTSVKFAEALKPKEDINTSTAPGSMTTKIPKEGLQVNCKKCFGTGVVDRDGGGKKTCPTCGGDGKVLEESCQDGEERFKEDEKSSAENGMTEFPMEEFHAGLKVEMEHIETLGGDVIKVARTVLDHLEENKEYYTDLKKIEALQTEIGDKEIEGLINPALGANDQDIKECGK